MSEKFVRKMIPQPVAADDVHLYEVTVVVLAHADEMVDNIHARAVRCLLTAKHNPFAVVAGYGAGVKKLTDSRARTTTGMKMVCTRFDNVSTKRLKELPVLFPQKAKRTAKKGDANK